MQNILDQLKIKANVVNFTTNGVVEKYFLSLCPGEKVSKIENRSTEIALCLKACSKPIIKVITEEGLVVVEVLVKRGGIVNFSDIGSNNDYKLPIIIGKTYDGADLICDLADMPHLLVSGTTGSGKSVLLHSIICSIIKSHKQTKMILIDPKRVEFTHYSNVKQLARPVINSVDESLGALSDIIDEMEKRFYLMERKSANNIEALNSKLKTKLPYIVMVIDEFADLMMSSKKIFSQKICMLAQKSRACGIHLILATQRPSVDIVTGTIKANFPARISCKVSSFTDSKVVFGCGGAEKLLGKGDALIKTSEHDMVRFRSAYISSDEIVSICSNNKKSSCRRIFDFLNKESFSN